MKLTLMMIGSIALITAAQAPAVYAQATDPAASQPAILQPPVNVPVPRKKPQVAPTMPDPAVPDADEPMPDQEHDAAPAQNQDAQLPVEEPSREERAKCEMELKRNGAVFEPIKPIRDSAQCGIEAPVELRGISASIKLDTPAKLGCDAALALTLWVQQSVVPNLKTAMPDKQLSSLTNVSGYVCRNRNHSATGKISEHAKGNAIDIAALGFADGSMMEMKPRAKDGTLEGAFQRTITASACLYFRTVLSPGSDPTHEEHLHLDVMARNNDFRYCL